MMRFSRALTRPSPTARVIRQSRGLVVPSQSHKAQEAAVRLLQNHRYVVDSADGCIELRSEEGISHHRSRVRLPLDQNVVQVEISVRIWTNDLDLMLLSSVPEELVYVRLSV